MRLTIPFGDQLGVDGGLCLAVLESEQAQRRLITRTEHGRAGPFQIQGLVAAHEGTTLTDQSIGGDRACRDAPAGQRVRHAEAQLRLALRIGNQIGLPCSGIHFLAAWPLQHLHAALAAIAGTRWRGRARHCHVVGDEGQTGRGANVVTARVIEKLADGRRDFGLQGIDHFIHDRHRESRRHTAILQAGLQVHRDHVARRIDFALGGDGHVHAGHGDLDAGVLETVFTALGVEHREGEIRRKGIGNGNARFHLGVVESFELQPVRRLTQQRGRFHLIAFQRQQGIADRLGEGDQCLRRVARLILRFVEHDLDAARRALDALAAHRVPRAAKDHAIGIQQTQVVGAGLVEGDAERGVLRGQTVPTATLIFQPHPFVAHRLLLPHSLQRIAELDRLACRTEAFVGHHAILRRAALDQDFLAGLDPVSRAIAGKHGQQIATRFIGRRQLQTRLALGVGLQFGARQLDWKLAEVLQFVVHHRQLLRAQAELHIGRRNRLAIGIDQTQLAKHGLVGMQLVLVQIENDLEMRLDVFRHPEGTAVELASIGETQFVAASSGVVGQLETRIRTTLARKVES